MDHPFDRYANVTDLAALKEASETPLRKCVRANTLKCTVDSFEKYAAEKQWNIDPVQWCKEGWFVDRPLNGDGQREPLGKDLLHLLGHLYMQEASSMLPVTLLDPQLGEYILDLSAAPGSKTTQIAARMNNTGVVVGNDMVESRLWTLKTAIHRLGVINTIITKKKGQWFGQYMAERFDRVLCDAPCTAQGTSRKDPTALRYSKEQSIYKAAKVQKELLTAALHACRVGGRIVYSTCTLTPEENEGVVGWLLERFAGKVEVVNPTEKRAGDRKEGWDSSRAIDDSHTVQREFSPARTPAPALRLWPQTYNTEGFFCAVFTKTAPTCPRERFEPIAFQERPLKKSEQKKTLQQLEKMYGTSFMLDDEWLFQVNDKLMLSTDAVRRFKLPMINFSLGLPYAKGLKGSRFRITPELATARGQMAETNTLELTDDQLQTMLTGKDSTCPNDLKGDVVLTWQGRVVGVGLAKDGTLKNRLSRWIVGQFG